MLGGSKYFGGGPNTTVKFGPGVQILRDSTSTLYRLKEELIRELVKNSRTMKGLNESYLSKIQKLERVRSMHARKVPHVFPELVMEYAFKL